MFQRSKYLDYDIPPNSQKVKISMCMKKALETSSQLVAAVALQIDGWSQSFLFLVFFLYF